MSELKIESYLSQSGYWTEGEAYQINDDQATQLNADAKSLLVCFSEAMDYVTGHKNELSKFIFTSDEEHDQKIRHLVRASWADKSSRKYIMDRWDIAWDGINPFKLLERNFGHLGLVIGTGPVQEDYIHWLGQQDGYQDVRSFASLQKHIVRAFREVADECGIYPGMHLAIAGWVNQEGSDPGMIQAARVLSQWVRRAGFAPDLIEAHSARFDEGITFLCRYMSVQEKMRLKTPNGFFLANAPLYFKPEANGIFNFGSADQYTRSVAEFSTEEQPIPPQKTKSLQPFWTLLAAHKGMLAVMHHLFPNHPNLLPTFWGDKALEGEKRIIKHVLGMQGLGSTILGTTGEKMMERPDNKGIVTPLNGPMSYITQAYCEAVSEPTGGFKVFNLFTTLGNNPAALGVRWAPEAFVGGDDTKTRFSPVIVRSRTALNSMPAGVA